MLSNSHLHSRTTRRADSESGHGIAAHQPSIIGLQQFGCFDTQINSRPILQFQIRQRVGSKERAFLYCLFKAPVPKDAISYYVEARSDACYSNLFASTQSQNELALDVFPDTGSQ